MIRRKSVLASAVVTLTAAGAAMFSGLALAGGHHHGGTHDNDGGNGGDGGETKVNCVLPIGASAGILGQGDDVSQCNAVGGNGGEGGDGVN
ncbi:hypothetical protein GCM10023321_16720 [Pseudonocardia eucalypti]|uniref:Small secreted domain DUF320 n=1 Tax=Pseudonocardia eucalypti TaxID=648755 RepID=A0ABP9PRD5_9PSEU|nr:hypothetical protein [Pseudonocardia eucalypti]